MDGLGNTIKRYYFLVLRPQLFQNMTNETGHYPLWNKVKYIDLDTGTPVGGRVKEDVHITLYN